MLLKKQTNQNHCFTKYMAFPMNHNVQCLELTDIYKGIHLLSLMQYYHS